MRIGALTYTESHRKTYDTLCLLKARGYDAVSVYAVPFHYKKTFKPLYRHRPEMNIKYPPIEDICQAFGYELFKINDYDTDSIKEETLLLCGAGLLSDEFVERHRIINAHPGYIPYARGLDALKWAIVEGNPIGVSTHFIGKEVDAGEMIERRLVPVRNEDTFHAVAQRVYETEIEMLVSSLNKINQPHEYISGGDYPIHRRMPHEIEEHLMERFDELKMMLKDNGGVTRTYQARQFRTTAEYDLIIYYILSGIAYSINHIFICSRSMAGNRKKV